MAGPKALDNLKSGPKEDKVVVASGIAISVVVILLVGWAIAFFHGIQKGSQQLNLSGGAQDEFNFQSVKEAQQQLQQEYSNNNADLVQIRNDAASQQMQTEQQVSVQQIQGSGSDQFGTLGH